MTYEPTFATVISDVDTNNTVYVDSLSAFPEPVGNVITLESGIQYILTKPIDCGVNQLKIPDNGVVSLGSTNVPVNILTSNITDTTPFITGDILRLDIIKLNIASGTGTQTCFELGAGNLVFATLFLDQATVQGFAGIGSLDGSNALNIISENVGWIFNGAGLTLNDMAIIQMAEQNFFFQTGDHITLTGTNSTVQFNAIAAAPQTGDRVFNLDDATVTNGANFISIVFDNSNGGTTGLEVTYDTDTVLENIFEFINVDTSGGEVQLTLPDATSNGITTGKTLWITDLGNAETNRINIIPNPADGSTIEFGANTVIDEDNAKLVIQYQNDSGQWIIIGNSSGGISQDNIALHEDGYLMFFDTGDAVRMSMIQ